jgi:hypothetical protein
VDVHTCLLDILLITPRLAITVSEKKYGKSTLLRLRRLVFQPMYAANATVVCRVAEMKRPTSIG